MTELPFLTNNCVERQLWIPELYGRPVKVTTKEYTLLDGSEREIVQRVGDGSIITRFEKTPLPEKPTDVVCPHFLELKWAIGCPYSCAWCYLKGTLRFAPEKTKPRVKDYEKIRLHVGSFLSRIDGHGELLNTGELADSLMWERNGKPFSTFIVSLFQQQKRHKVLFLSKSNYIQNLLDLDTTEQVVVSFSLNADSVARRFENGAPPQAERLKAASKLSEAGFEVRLRIDPMVPIPNWQEEYRALVDQIFSCFRPERITLGSLRGLQSTINQATDKSWTSFLTERSGWGRRVSFHKRYQMYQQTIDHLREYYSYTDVALCKETLQIWNALSLDYRRIRCNCIL